MKKAPLLSPLRYSRTSISLALLFLAPLSASAVVNFTEVQWMTWSPVANPGASTGTVNGQSVSVTITGTHAADAGGNTSNFDLLGDQSYTMAAPYLGVGAPRNNTTVTYTIDLSSLTVSTSDLIVGIADLDAINGRGSLTVSALDDLVQASNVNTWTTAGQFKQQAGLPDAQALVTRAASGNDMVLGSTQAADNTAWGDSRGAFFADLASGLSSITIIHEYGHPNPAVSDSMAIYVGLVPEPSTWGLLFAAAGLLFVVQARKTRNKS